MVNCLFVIVSLPCLLIHPGNSPRSSCPNFSASSVLPSAASAPNRALHKIDLEAEVSQAQSAGGGVDHSHQRDYGKSAMPR